MGVLHPFYFCFTYRRCSQAAQFLGTVRRTNRQPLGPQLGERVQESVMEIPSC